ncbi:MAG TPA: hypothetical protein VFQ91_07005 [Bryobacteraceae bacterium]|nr:hypothetical protein [Bryobacteraceae bacterium]
MSVSTKIVVSDRPEKRKDLRKQTYIEPLAELARKQGQKIKVSIWAKNRDAAALLALPGCCFLFAAVTDWRA